MPIAPDEGSKVYAFDPAGGPLRTRDAITGAKLYTYAYDSTGLLTSITDADSRVTTFERDAGNSAAALTAVSRCFFALAEGGLGPKIGERIAVAVA